MNGERHDWRGDDFQQVCAKCKLLRNLYDGIRPGYLGRQTGDVWVYRRTPPRCLGAS